MQKTLSKWFWVLVILIAVLLITQAISYLLAPDAWNAFYLRLPVILSMVAFWGPVVAVFVMLLLWLVMRLLGFNSITEIRHESVEQNNPTPAIIFVGTLIASILFFLVVIKP